MTTAREALYPPTPFMTKAVSRKTALQGELSHRERAPNDQVADSLQRIIDGTQTAEEIARGKAFHEWFTSEPKVILEGQLERRT